MIIEQRMKMSVADTGRKHSDEMNAAQSVRMMGHVLSEATKAKIGEANSKNHPVFSVETRAKLSAALMGHPMLDVTRDALLKANRGRPLSAEHRAKMSEITSRRVGPLAAAWKGGITPELKMIRTSEAYSSWRTAVFARDDYTCQDCGQHGGYLEAHHVHEFSKYPEERLLVENGKTLCLPCHEQYRKRTT